MLNENDRDDSMLDRNLKKIATQIQLPDKPTARQRAMWQSSPGHIDVEGSANRHDDGGLPRPNRRFLTFAGAGSAIAACVAFCALLIIPSAPTAVHAGAIFASFRQSLENSIRLTLENVGAEGVRMNGTMLVVLPDEDAEPSPSAAPGSASGTAADALADAGFFVQCRVKVDQDAPELAGLDVEVKLAIAAGNEWAYVRLNNLPPELREESPFVPWLENFTRRGVLLELDGLLEGKLIDESLFKAGFEEWISALSSGDQEAVKQGLKELGMEDEEDEGGGAAKVGGDHAGGQSDAEVQLERIVEKLLTGHATADDLQVLVTFIEQGAGNVDVEQTANGAYILNAGDFKIEGVLDQKEADMIAKLVLRIQYRPGTGVEKAELLHVGQYDGTIRFGLETATIGDPLFDKHNTLEPGVTTVINVGQMMEFVKPWFDNAVADDN